MDFVGNAYLSGADATPRKCHLVKMLSRRKQESLVRDNKEICCIGFDVMGRKCTRR